MLNKTYRISLASENNFQVLSNYGRKMFYIVNYSTVCSTIALFGIVANLINIKIFYSQGLHTTINISFFGLAVSDLFSLLTQQWINFCMNPLFEATGVPVETSEFEYLTGGWPQLCFTRITSWITVYITAERCLCIIMPLKVKLVVTPRKTTIIICFIYISMMMCLIPEYATTYIDWKFYPRRNRTLLGLVFTSNRQKLESLVIILNTVLILLSFLAITTFTAILVVKLRGSTEWRKRSAFHKNQAENISNRDKKTANMVLLIASVLIVCYIPSLVLFMVTLFEPEFSVLGRYANIFFGIWSFGFIFVSINSSVNIFLYYRMSSKYRKTFHELFCLPRNRVT